MQVDDIIVDNILLDEKSYENIFVITFYTKKIVTAERLCIRFAKLDGMIKIYNGIRYSE